MKKLITLFLSFVLIFCAVGCGGNKGVKPGDSTCIIPEEKQVVLGIGQNYDIEIQKFSINGADGDKSLLTYTSSNSDVLTVSGNTATAVSIGMATVSVAYGGVEAKIVFEVKEVAYALSLEKSDVALVKDVLTTHTIEVEKFTKNGKALDNSLISYQTSDPTIVSVESGVLTAVGEGEATITASYHDVQDTLSVKVYQGANASDVEEMNENAVVIQGRAYKNGTSLVFDNVNSGIEYWFYGTECKIKLNVANVSKQYYCYLAYFIDGVKGELIKLNQIGTDVTVTLATGLSEGVHTVSIMKATEQSLYTAGNLQMIINSLITSENCIILKPLSTEGRIKIDFYGDSITCGSGNLGDSATGNLYTTVEDGTMSYAAITGRSLNAMVSMVSYSGISVKADVNGLGETNIYNYWDKYSTINQDVYTIDTATDYVIINLGTNDANAINEHDYTTDNFKQDFLDLLTAMKAKYTGSTKFIWCYGMMGENGTVKTGIQNALTEMGGENAGFYYLTLPLNQQGALGHPNVQGHIDASEILIDFINGL